MLPFMRGGAQASNVAALSPAAVAGTNMWTPVMMLAGADAAQSTSATRFMPPFEGSVVSDRSTTVTPARTPCPVAGTIGNLELYFPSALVGGTESYTITLEKNGSDSTLVAQITNASLRASDTTHNITIAEGDDICLKNVPANTPTAQTIIMASMLFKSTEGAASPIFGGTTNVGITATTYCPFGSARNTAAEVDSQVVCAAAGTIDKLYVHIGTTPGAGNSWTFTLYKNGSSTGLTCSITNGSTSGNDTNSGHAVTIAAGDRISVECAATGTPTATLVTFGCRWQPTTNGESLLFAQWTTNPTTNADRFCNANGNANSQATESKTYNLVPYACTIKNMYHHVTTGPGGGTRTRSCWLRAGAIGGSQADTSLTTVITDTATDASDTNGGHAYSASLADLLDIRTNSSASATAPAQMTVGMVAYIAPQP